MENDRKDPQDSLNWITFYEEPIESEPGAGLQPERRARVTAGLQTKAELLSYLARKLDFPYYFGRNWDALADCLHDLSWLEDVAIRLVHADVPLKEPEEQASYLGILRDAVASWEENNPRRLSVLFPLACRPTVERLISID